MRKEETLALTVLCFVVLSSFSINVEGKTFEPNIKVPQTSRLAEQPSLTLREGNIFIVWQDRRSGDYDVYFTESLNNGTTFAPAQRVNDKPLGDTSAQEYPDIAVSRERIYVVWEDYRSGNADVYLSVMNSSGLFSQDVAVASDQAHKERQPAVCVDEERGILYVAWVSDDKDIMLATSHDFGRTFTPPVLVSDSRLHKRGDVDLALGRNGTVFALWTDGRTGTILRDEEFIDDDDIFISSSSDGGLTFTENKRIHDSYRGVMQYNSSVDVDGNGRVYVAWSDERIFMEPSILFSKSYDGDNFTKPIFVNESALLEDGVGVPHRFPSISVDRAGREIIIAWSEERAGNFNIYAARSTDGGVTFQPFQIVDRANCFFDDIASRNGLYDMGEATLLDNGNGVLDPGILNGVSSPDEIVAPGRGNLQEDLAGKSLLFDDFLSDGWDYADDIIIDSPTVFYPQIEIKQKNAWDNTTGNYPNYLREIDNFYYRVKKGQVMGVGWFDLRYAKESKLRPENMGLRNDDPISSALLEVTYKTDPSYNVSASLMYSLALGQNFTVCKINNTGGSRVTVEVDIFSMGVDSIWKLKQLNLSFENNASADVYFNLILLKVTRGLPGRFDSYDFVIYNGSNPSNMGNPLSPFSDEDNVMFIDDDCDGAYDDGEAIVHTPQDVQPGGDLTADMEILKRFGGHPWDTSFSPFPVNDDSVPADHDHPKVAMDNAGGVYAVWEDSRAGYESVFYSDTVSDVFGPSPLTFTPSQGGSYVLQNTNISIRFSEPMNLSTVEDAFSIWPFVPGQWQSNGYGDVLTFQPQVPLESNTTYSVVIETSASDLSGNHLMDRIRLRFRTASFPHLEHEAIESSLLDEEASIRVNFTDADGALSVQLFYRNVSSKNFSEVGMTLESGDIYRGTWTGSIPPQGEIGWLSYFIIATNNRGFSSKLPAKGEFSIRVYDGLPPEITHEPLKRAREGSVINFTALVEDDHGVESVLLFIKPVSGGEFNPPLEMRQAGGGVYYLHFWAGNETGTLEYYIVALDYSANSATYPADNPIQNPCRVSIEGPPDYSWLLLLLLCLLFLIGMILVLSYLVMGRKKKSE